MYGGVKESLVELIVERTRLGRHSSFLDIGSGIGQTCIQVAATVCCDAVRGIEIDRARYDSSILLLKVFNFLLYITGVLPSTSEQTHQLPRTQSSAHVVRSNFVANAEVISEQMYTEFLRFLKSTSLTVDDSFVWPPFTFPSGETHGIHSSNRHRAGGCNGSHISTTCGQLNVTLYCDDFMLMDAVVHSATVIYFNNFGTWFTDNQVEVAARRMYTSLTTTAQDDYYGTREAKSGRKTCSKKNEKISAMHRFCEQVGDMTYDSCVHGLSLLFMN